MYKTIKQEQREVFFADMELLGFDDKATNEELTRLTTCETELEYIKTSRVGATVRLSRANRKEIFNSYSLWVA